LQVSSSNIELISPIIGTCHAGKRRTIKRGQIPTVEAYGQVQVTFFSEKKIG
jgi:hypothetical protein